MVNQFTPFIFVYSACSAGLNFYDNDITRANTINPHIITLFKDIITNFVYDDKYFGYSMPTADVTKLIEIVGNSENSVVIDTGNVIKNKLQTLADLIDAGMKDNVFLAVYYIR